MPGARTLFVMLGWTILIISRRRKVDLKESLIEKRIYFKRNQLESVTENRTWLYLHQAINLEKLT